MVKGTELEDLTQIIAYYNPANSDQLGVKLNLGKAATAEEILALKPDAVVVAAGGTHRLAGYQGYK